MLRPLMVVLALLGTTFTGTLYAQDITGDWQGTFTAARVQRTILRISGQLDGSLQLRMLLIDENPPDWGSGNLANAVSPEGSDFKFSINGLKASYEGKLSPDGNVITGTLSRDKPIPFEVVRVTRENAWRDPAPHADQSGRGDSNGHEAVHGDPVGCARDSCCAKGRCRTGQRQ